MLTRMAPLLTRMARMLTRMTRWLAGSHIIRTLTHSNYTDRDMFALFVLT